MTILATILYTISSSTIPSIPTEPWPAIRNMSSELLSIHDSHTERHSHTASLRQYSLLATISDTHYYGWEHGGQEGSRGQVEERERQRKQRENERDRENKEREERTNGV